jgi:DNA-binding NtrC family response regulator
MITEGQFREDLFYRLNVIHLVVPPLRDRKEDVPALVDHFLGRMRRPDGGAFGGITADAMAALVAYPWPGNVRELQNIIERIVVRAHSEVIGIQDIPADVRAAKKAGHAPIKERRKGVADELYKRIVDERESFWTTVYPLFMRREITRASVLEIVRRGLQDARGNYKIVARMFNMEPDEYKKFLNFLRKHHCQPSFKEFR